jgi:hypothetical protein
MPTLVVAARFAGTGKASKNLRIIGDFFLASDKKRGPDSFRGQPKKSLVILSISISGFTQDEAGSSR